MQYTFDADGWYSGNNPADAAAGRVTTVDPEVVEGGPGMRWDGVEWVAHPQPVIDPAHEAAMLLESTDAVTGARGVEDVISILLAKGVITEADIPAALAERIAARELARSMLEGRV